MRHSQKHAKNNIGIKIFCCQIDGIQIFYQTVLFFSQIIAGILKTESVVTKDKAWYTFRNLSIKHVFKKLIF